ncbi:MAG TPA: toxin-antitoxin system HicB family antitoxin [Acidimicrobiales bacterium]|jgi:hypothetical protein|nr:toxin-antitoxin system HicB family antitoxin [Acidimicrobiales bacterium]
MDLRGYVENIQRHLLVAADAGGDDARGMAERLLAPLDSTVRLTLQDALGAAAEEITTELAPGSVELRLRGGELEFVVTPAPAAPAAGDRIPDEASDAAAGGISPHPDGDDGAMSRINLRLPDHLKSRIEQAAASEGLSVNAWLVRAAAAALNRASADRLSEPHSARGSQRYTGWAR